MGIANHRAAGWGLAAGLVALLLPVTDAGAIMRRDDVPDAQYVVDAADHPALVDLIGPGDCIATVIAERWLVTAAHCAAYVPKGHVIAIAGTEHTVAGVVCHPAYSGFEHDVALVHLDDAITDVTPLGLYRERDEAGQQVLFVGRGDTGTGKDGQPGATNDGKTRAATNLVHNARTRWLEFIFDRPGDADVTPTEGISGDGDSGGPALIVTADGLKVAGLSSWQDAEDEDVGFYGVHDFYTRTSMYVEFIDTTIGPDWDGSYRTCPAEDGCACRLGATSTIAVWLGLVVLLAARRRC